MTDNFFKNHWAGRKAQVKQSQESGNALIELGLDRISVAVPFNPDFASGARALSGKWRPKTMTWTFKREALELVQALAGKCFGKGKVKVQYNLCR